MTITVTITSTHGAEHSVESITLTDPAMQRARLGFNPSGNARVNRIKALVAALYVELEKIPDEIEAKLCDDAGEGNSIPSRPIETARREASTAATHLQAGAMFAVSAATAHLS